MTKITIITGDTVFGPHTRVLIDGVEIPRVYSASCNQNPQGVYELRMLVLADECEVQPA